MCRHGGGLRQQRQPFVSATRAASASSPDAPFGFAGAAAASSPAASYGLAAAAAASSSAALFRPCRRCRVGAQPPRRHKFRCCSSRRPRRRCQFYSVSWGRCELLQYQWLLPPHIRSSTRLPFASTSNPSHHSASPDAYFFPPPPLPPPPISAAALNNHASTVRLLFHAGAHPDATFKPEGTALNANRSLTAPTLQPQSPLLRNSFC